MRRICFCLVVLLISVECAMTEAPPKTIPRTFFGMHTGEKKHWPTVTIGALGKGTMVNWCYSEPSKGVFNWPNLDAWVNLATSHNLSYFYSNGGTPKWAVNDQRTCKDYGYAVKCSGMVRDIGDWDTFITALVNRYKGKLIYELWNEPGDSFHEYQQSYTLSIPDVVTTTNHMHDRIRSIDPGAIIISPSPSGVNSAAYMDAYWTAGGTKDIDVVSIHGYPTYPSRGDMADTESFFPLTRIDQLKAVMAKHGINKPIWDTEGSWGDPSWGTTITDIDSQIAYIAQAYLLHWSYGVERFYWYSWDGSGNWGTLWDAVNGHSLAATSYQQTYNWMVGAVMSVPCSKDVNNTWTCGLTRPGGYKALAIWNSSTTLSYTPLSIYKQYRDLSGGKHTITGPIQISTKPVLLETSTFMNPPYNLLLK